MQLFREFQSGILHEISDLESGLMSFKGISQGFVNNFMNLINIFSDTYENVKQFRNS